MVERNWLQLDGPIAVAGAAEHPHAARRLGESWPSLAWMRLPEGAEAASDHPLVKLETDAALPEGGFAIDVRDDDGPPRIAVRGGPFSGVIYAVEEMIQRRSREAGVGIEIAAGGATAEPGLPYRTFWTWDHTTNWDLEQIGVQEIGVVHPYSKPPDGFLRDYKRMVDFMSRQRIAAVVIFGFFRDSHGGVEAAQKLCRYANERGVRILPGIAINAYGGVYWEGEHPYNLATWLAKEPAPAIWTSSP